MKQILYFLISILFPMNEIFATAVPDILKLGGNNGSILNGDAITLISVLTLVQSLLLKLVLPIVIIGGSLYIAYELFTADGDEAKMKKAWKSVAYTATALISIALSYGLVSIISRLSI